jgi:hypothetical protein
MIGVLTELKAGQTVAAEDDPDQVRGQRLDRFDPAGQ